MAEMGALGHSPYVGSMFGFAESGHGSGIYENASSGHRGTPVHIGSGSE
jgi:hypothetical protein